MKNQPSDMFLGAILRGYDAEARSGKPVSCSGIWDRICIEAMPIRRAFGALFAWDNPSPQRVNRIGTIRDCIREGYVPGLRLGKDARGRDIVEREVGPCAEIDT